MVQWSTARTQIKSILKRTGQVILGILYASSRGYPAARLQAMAEDKVHPVPCVFDILSVLTEPEYICPSHTAGHPLHLPDVHLLGPHRGRNCAIFSAARSISLGVLHRKSAERFRLHKIWCHHCCQREKLFFQRFLRILRYESAAACGYHDRV